MIIDGKKIAREIRDGLVGSTGSLHIFVVGENPVVENFVRYKKIFANAIGVEFVEHRFAPTVTEIDLLSAIKEASNVANGILVQLRLPLHIDARLVLDAVPSELDIDGLATQSDYLAPVAGAVREIIEYECITVDGKQALVVGRGKLVGKPVAELLTSMGAIVTVADKETSKGELVKLARASDIIVSGAGAPNLITRDMVKEGSVLLDAGTSTQNNSVVGDIAPECRDMASHFARTPGGIGPLTVAVLFKNLVSGTVMTK